MKKVFFTLMCLFAIAISCTKDEPPVLPETGDSPIKINEAYSNGGRATYGTLDWVELYNNSDAVVNISGYVLYDKIDKSEKVTIPSGTTIAARGFFTIDVDVDGGFGLSSGGDVVYLEDAEGKLVDNIEFGALTPEQSWARVPDGSDDSKVQTPTPNASNNDVAAPPVEAVVDYTGLVINEVDGNGKFIELYNSSTTTVPLAGVTLKKDEESTWWTGGAASITAGGYYVISNGNQSGITADETTGASGISAKKNVKFELFVPDNDTPVDAFARRTSSGNWGDDTSPDYSKTTPKYSFSRCPDGTGNFGLAVPSSNAANPATAEGPIEAN
jgi:hypothetical protein